MSTQENKALIHRYYDDVLNAENLDPLDDFYSENFVDHSGLENRDGIRKVLFDHFRAYLVVKFSIEDMIAEGDNVVVRSNMTFTKEDKKETVSRHQIAIYRIAEGQIVERWAHSDYFY